MGTNDGLKKMEEIGGNRLSSRIIGHYNKANFEFCGHEVITKICDNKIPFYNILIEQRDFSTRENKIKIEQFHKTRKFPISNEKKSN